MYLFMDLIVEDSLLVLPRQLTKSKSICDISLLNQKAGQNLIVIFPISLRRLTILLLWIFLRQGPMACETLISFSVSKKNSEPRNISLRDLDLFYDWRYLIHC